MKMFARFAVVLAVLAVALLAGIKASSKYTVKVQIWSNTDCSGDPVESETISNGYCLVCADDDCLNDAYRVTCSDGGDTVQLKSYDNDDCTNADNVFDINDGNANECLAGGAGSAEVSCKKDDDDDDDNVCFHGEELVMLQSGVSKPIADVRVGDRIQIMRSDASLAFSDVVFVPHAVNLKTATFIELETTAGRALKVTPEHLVLNGACGASAAAELTRANEIEVGSCVRTVEGEEEVSKITQVQDKGIYTAVTADAHGHIVVNGIVASSFGTNHFVPNLYYTIHRMLYAVLPQWMMESESFKATSLLIGGFFISASVGFRK